MTEGFIGFDELNGKFWIVDEDDKGLVALDFGDTFEVKVEDKWVETGFAIGSNDQGEMVFTLKNTPFNDKLAGVPVRMK